MSQLTDERAVTDANLAQERSTADATIADLQAQVDASTAAADLATLKGLAQAYLDAPNGEDEAEQQALEDFLSTHQ